jgi:putative hemin transport protein
MNRATDAGAPATGAATGGAPSAGAVLARWRELLAQRRPRQRDAAEALGVSEAELVAARIADDGDDRVTRLAVHGRALDFVRAIQPLGRVMALTRNAACVHEKDGVYNDVDGGDKVGLVLDPEIDLRLFFDHWVHAFAVEETGPRGTLRSLQVYDRWGDAVHKIFLRPASEVAAYHALVAAWRDADQSPGIAVDATPAPVPAPADDPDVPAFREGWLAMKDTHEFFPLLKKHALPRRQALRLAPAEHARRVDNATIGVLLARAAQTATPIMVFVGSRGCIQIHSGTVANVVPMGEWLNVMDPGFNLHLRTDWIAETWWVRKPTSDGPVHSLELFDAAGETIALVFGARKPGKPELPSWTSVLAECLVAAPHGAAV